jgi:serine/threonine-protein kinase
VLGEIIDDLYEKGSFFSEDMHNAFFFLIELGSWEFANEKMRNLQASSDIPAMDSFAWFETLISSQTQPLSSVFQNFYANIPDAIEINQKRTILYLLYQALDRQEFDLVHKYSELIEKHGPAPNFKLELHIRRIWAYLLEKNWQKAGKLINAYPIELLSTDSTLLHFLYGCWLRATEGKEMSDIHYMGLLPVNYPRSWTLASHELMGTLSPAWHHKAFLWEKRQLYRQLALYYHCAGKNIQQAQESYYQQFIHV